jgi:hypothetical protein
VGIPRNGIHHWWEECVDYSSKEVFLTFPSIKTSEFEMWECKPIHSVANSEFSQYADSLDKFKRTWNLS